PEVGQVFDGRLGGQASVTSTQLLGNIGIELGETLDVQFVDEGLVPGDSRRTVIAPGEGRIHYYSQRGVGCTVAIVERQVELRILKLVGKQLIVPPNVTTDQLGIRVEHELVGVEPVPLDGLERPVDPVAIELARQYIGEVSVPDFVCVLLQRDP